MDYQKAYAKLYGASGAAIEALFEVRVVSAPIDRALGVLLTAIADVEQMEGSDGKRRDPEKKSSERAH